MITIDGSDGGGQMLRTALALSTITQKPFSMINIRGNRNNPGLKPQHLTCIDAIKKITGATCDAKLNDKEIIFTPGKINKTKEDINIGTAGSITLLLQSLVPILIYSKKISNFNIIGGTDVNWSPSIDYYKEVILNALSSHAEFKLKILKRGFYPKGGGQINIMIKPKKEFPKVNLTERGNLVQVIGTSLASKDLSEKEVCERIKKNEEVLLKEVKHSKLIQAAYADTFSIGVITTLVAKYEKVSIGSDVLGEKEISSEEIGTLCAKKLLERMHSNAICDEHLTDNLIPYIGLFGGEIITDKITNHIKTNIEITNMFLDKKIIIEEIVDEEKTNEVNSSEKENKTIIKIKREE
ncbi:MAG: RNA 3'-terminal phosphate cyclase [Candidatus Woesearchaeota archaeon]|jgi:RNA 3'-phosphate cyclase